MMKNDIIKEENNYMSDNISCFFQIAFILFLIFLLFGNIGSFFFFKNSTRDIRMAIAVVNNDIEEEKKRISMINAEINKEYNSNYLQELGKQKLNLSFSNVKQITSIEEALSK